MHPAPRRVDGAKVRTLRQSRGEPLLPFSRRVDVSKRLLEYIELHDYQRVRPETLARIAAGLEVAVDELLVVLPDQPERAAS